MDALLDRRHHELKAPQLKKYRAGEPARPYILMSPQRIGVERGNAAQLPGNVLRAEIGNPAIYEQCPMCARKAGSKTRHRLWERICTGWQSQRLPRHQQVFRRSRQNSCGRNLQGDKVPFHRTSSERGKTFLAANAAPL